MLVTILALIVVLGVLIFVHEAGHFIAAKWAGIYVHRFSLGLGSPIPWLTFKRGETEYSISWLPLGGYVKMASREEEVTSSALEGGHVDAPVPPDRVFEAKPVWKRMVVILAGVTMNALFAWFAFTFLAAKNGRQIDPTTTVGQVIGEMVPPGGEALRDIPVGSRIVAINGRPVKSWNDVSEGIANSPESEVRLELDGGRTMTLPIHQDALEERLKAAQALQPFRPAVIGQVLPGRPAARAGLHPGDTILAIGDHPIAQWYAVLEVLQANTGTPLTMTVAGDSGRRTLDLQPEVETIEGLDGKPRKVGRVGNRQLLDPDRTDGPGPLHRPDLAPRGRRPDHDRAAGGGECPYGSGPLPRLHGPHLNQPGRAESAPGAGAGRRSVPVSPGGGRDPAPAAAQAEGAADRSGDGADRPAHGAGVQ